MGNKALHSVAGLKARRKQLRENMTSAEAVLWTNLQGRRLDGYKFRRQHSVGRYVLDFYCPERRLAIELDGEGHFNPMAEEYDRQRTDFLNRQNIQVLRFENKQIFDGDLEFVLGAIRSALIPHEV